LRPSHRARATSLRRGCTIALACAGALLPTHAIAQTVAPIDADRPQTVRTLAAAIALAYRNNPTLQATRYDLRGVDERIAQAKAELRLRADAQATAGYQWNIEGRVSRRENLFGTPYSAQSQSQLGLSVQQPLYTGGHATAARRSAEATVSAGEQRLRATEGDLLLSVVSTYMDIYRFGAEREVRADSVQELHKLLDEIEARQVAGELTRSDIAQARGQVAQAEAQLLQAEQSLRTAQADFLSVVGAELETAPVPPALPGLPADPDRASFLAAQRSPELAYARNTAQASLHDVEAARATGRPTLAVRGSAGLSGQAKLPYRLPDKDQAYSGSVMLSVPLLGGGLRASQVREATARAQADRLRIEAAERELARVVTDAWNDIATADRIGTISAQRREAAGTQLEGMLAEYRLGLRSTFDLLYAQQTLRDAEVAVLDAERDRYVSRATLLRRIGTLEADDLTSGVPLHDPKPARAAAREANRLPLDDTVGALDAILVPAARVHAPTRPAPAVAPMLKPDAAAIAPQPITPSLRKPNP
jgi:outer membrane protein